MSVKKLRLVIGASVREQMRWAGQHLYTLLILSPLVFGISYATVSRLAEEAPAWQPSYRLSLVLCMGLIFSLIGLSLTRASTELYHLRQPESVLDALPVPLSTQLHAACLKRLARVTLFGLLILIVRALAGAGRFLEASVLLPLACLILIIALAELFTALSWIHWGHTKNGLTATGAILTGIVSAMLAGLLLLWMLKPVVSQGRSERWLVLCGALWAGALYLLTRVMHQRWRASDIEYAKRLQAGGKLSVFGARFLKRRFERAVAVQLARDLQLTLRAFSSAVYVALFIFLLLLVILITVLVTGWLPAVAGEPGWFEATWLPSVMAVKITCVLASASCSILVAVLVAYQLPHFWLERATGATGKQMWETKLWYARLLSLPSPLIVWLIGMASGTVPLFYALPLLAECIWLWWLVSMLIGSLSFEVPDRPELAIVLMISSGAVFGLFVTLFWPIGIVPFATNVIRGLTERGHRRAKFCLMTEGD